MITTSFSFGRIALALGLGLTWYLLTASAASADPIDLTYALPVSHAGFVSGNMTSYLGAPESWSLLLFGAGLVVLAGRLRKSSAT